MNSQIARSIRNSRRILSASYARISEVSNGKGALHLPTLFMVTAPKRGYYCQLQTQNLMLGLELSDLLVPGRCEL